jgi:hypothetical protein
VDAGIFEDLEKAVLSKKKHNVSNFTTKDYAIGRRALKAFDFYCRAGIIKEMERGQFNEAARKIDLLTIVAMEYPTGNFCSYKRFLQQTCIDLLREKIKFEDKAVENVEIVYPVNSKPRLLTEREWNILLPIVECEHMGINKKKNWVPYADFVLKYKRKTSIKYNIYECDMNQC